MKKIADTNLTNNPFKIEVFYSPMDNAYVARLDYLHSISAVEPTPAKAVSELAKVIEMMCEEEL